ncbi:hypothetical protein L593_11020 [Salinarchaeum sp. Harcht-Bsk1]|uniref:hypothetical protein n=1 Tax=Salinarchaeum sp. Harcht-Bsk1 TaxID=1333523 RepID=UPI00034247BD|nr:hypothetical protein [Salinarchaeum sp. Harcht-Bsk1]AGN02149.1 hypothetical protein L593_11020 [Salinarchaeum sp. Harcht-Bsk1]
MVDPLILGVALFGLTILPFGTYLLLEWSKSDANRSDGRAVPSSTTQNAPSRTIPGSNGRDGD